MANYAEDPGNLLWNIQVVEHLLLGITDCTCELQGKTNYQVKHKTHAHMLAI